MTDRETPRPLANRQLEAPSTHAFLSITCTHMSEIVNRPSELSATQGFVGFIRAMSKLRNSYHLVSTIRQET